jgi:hypothetical protein
VAALNDAARADPIYLDFLDGVPRRETAHLLFNAWQPAAGRRFSGIRP